jgi:dTDP-4-amino-4,6-dideoxygalactose transaminase
MGLVMLPKLESIITERKKIFEIYDLTLPAILTKPNYKLENFQYNYSYYPVLFENEYILLKVKAKLFENEIIARRYFYPSLNTLPQAKEYFYSCPVSEDISSRVLCLPLYPGLSEKEIFNIADIITKEVS